MIGEFFKTPKNEHTLEIISYKSVIKDHSAFVAHDINTLVLVVLLGYNRVRYHRLSIFVADCALLVILFAM